MADNKANDGGMSVVHAADTILAAIEAIENQRGSYVNRREKLREAIFASEHIIDFLGTNEGSLYKKFNGAAHYSGLQKELETYERPTGRYLKNDVAKLAEILKEARGELTEMIGVLVDDTASQRDKRHRAVILANSLVLMDMRLAYVAYGKSGEINHIPLH